jgi:hypothetical protein
MATVLENLTTAREGAAAKLAACLANDYSSAEEFKPDFNGANSLDRTSYIRELRETLAFLDAEISKHDVFEVTSEMTA